MQIMILVSDENTDGKRFPKMRFCITIRAVFRMVALMEERGFSVPWVRQNHLTIYLKVLGEQY